MSDRLDGWYFIPSDDYEPLRDSNKTIKEEWGEAD